jgi:hypothetical protein
VHRSIRHRRSQIRSEYVRFSRWGINRNGCVCSTTGKTSRPKFSSFFFPDASGNNWNANEINKTNGVVRSGRQSINETNEIMIQKELFECEIICRKLFEKVRKATDKLCMTTFFLSVFQPEMGPLLQNHEKLSRAMKTAN